MAGKGETGILTLYSDVQETSVRWLWYLFIAVGKITLLQGDSGDGKSTMMMNLIAEFSKGGNTPDGIRAHWRVSLQMSVIAEMYWLERLTRQIF